MTIIRNFSSYSCRLDARKGLPKMEDVQRSSSLGMLIESEIKAFNGSITRNGGKPLVGALKRYFVGVVGGLNRSYVKVACVFAFEVYRLAQTMGRTGLVLYLKASQVLLMQAVARYRIPDTSSLKMRVRRSRQGLPSIIPLLHRRRIMAGEIRIIKLWMSFFALYRVLACTPNFSLSTISDPSPRWETFEMSPEMDEFEEFVDAFWDHLGERGLVDPFLESIHRGPRFFPIAKSSPQTAAASLEEGIPLISTAWPSLLRSASDLFNPYNLTVLRPFAEYCARCGDNTVQYFLRLVLAKQIFMDRYHHLKADDSAPEMTTNPFLRKEPASATIRTLTTGSQSAGATIRTLTAGGHTRNLGTGHLGKLGLKFEAAGKVRVFAMVDPWTQWLFWPLHKGIQGILRRIPSDGTFNQTQPLDRLVAVVQSWIDKGRKPVVASLDLSAATDRLPVGLQVKLLLPLLGGRARAWAKVLVNRTYILNAKAAGRFIGIYKYTVGQPMGALSSWVMLALTHHAIVQYCAWRVARSQRKSWKWFEDYAVLGDDVVIADCKVSASYRNFMARIGVGIGLAKSVMGRPGRLVMEFAKRFIVAGANASAVPLRDVFTALVSTAVASEFLTKYGYNLNDYLRLRGMGYRTRGSVTGNLWSLSNRLRVILVFLHAPGQVYGKELIAWLSMRTVSESYPIGSIPWSEVYDLLFQRWINDYIPRLQRYEKLIMTQPSKQLEVKLDLKRHPENPKLWLGPNGEGYRSHKEALASWRTASPDRYPEFDRFLTSELEKLDAPWPTSYGLSKDIETMIRSTQWRKASGRPHFGLPFGEPGVAPSHMAGPFRMPIIYGLVSNRDTWIDNGLRVASVNSGAPFTYLWSALENSYSPVWAHLVSELWSVMDRVDSELVFPRLTMDTLGRAEEKAYSSFLPRYRRWVEVQRIIFKARGRDLPERKLGTSPSPSLSLVVYKGMPVCTVTLRSGVRIALPFCCRPFLGVRLGCSINFTSMWSTHWSAMLGARVDILLDKIYRMWPVFVTKVLRWTLICKRLLRVMLALVWEIVLIMVSVMVLGIMTDLLESIGVVTWAPERESWSLNRVEESESPLKDPERYWVGLLLVVVGFQLIWLGASLYSDASAPLELILPQLDALGGMWSYETASLLEAPRPLTMWSDVEVRSPVSAYGYTELWAQDVRNPNWWGWNHFE